MSRYLLPLISLLFITPAQAATLLLCPGAPLASPGAIVADTTLPDGTQLSAIVTEAPDKPDPACRALPLKVTASGVQALHILPPDAVPGATLLLQGEERNKQFTITGHTLPEQRTPRAGKASKAGPAVSLQDGADAVAAIRQRAPRATWAWSPNAWRERGDALLDWAASQQIGELFINVPVQGERVADPAALAAFVRQAGGRGIGVTAFEDEPELMLPSERGAAIERIRAYLAYNAGAGTGALLKGVQFDIEPRLIDADVLPPAARDGHYLDLIAAVRQAAGNMPLDVVTPSAWQDEKALLRGLARHADSLTVRNYRTDAGQIMRHATPFLDWGVEHGKKVRIALEAGPVGAGVERSYRRMGPGARGDLLLFQLGGQKIVLLLKVPAAQDEALAYLLAGRRGIAGSATSFHADKAALMRLLPQLEIGFGAWESFGGMAVHELR